jgi:glycogen operon protein
VEYARQCLRFWVDECHVDGFRFDLASVMGRTPAFRQDAPLFEAIRNDPRLAEVKLIAEPWDIGPGGYQVGNFPPLFAEWNDHFRDTARRFWLQQNVSLGDFAQRFAASSDVFQRNGERLRRRLIWSPRTMVSPCATAFVSIRNIMRQTGRRIAMGLTITTATIMV